MKIEIDRSGTLYTVRVECGSTAQASVARDTMQHLSGGRGVHGELNLWSSCRRRDAEKMYRTLQSVTAEPPRAAQSHASRIADLYISRDGGAPVAAKRDYAAPCRCRQCGETNRGRFTTLPLSAQTCDDCA